ncbi:MAG TPA: cyclic-di-AMP receptor [Aggregatilineales bacterium]|nr:cyclic-di-AMP receptor [Anaerolineales bacterium]HRE47164.1 cyclic-di-AMP receptor [Aggregatilineales bacterium]
MSIDVTSVTRGMSLVVATIQDQDVEAAGNALTDKGFRFTRIGTTGGFLRQGNTTLLVGVLTEYINEVVNLLNVASHRRHRYVPMATGMTPNGMTLYNYVEVEVGGATIFVLTVDHFEQV